MSECDKEWLQINNLLHRRVAAPKKVLSHDDNDKIADTKMNPYSQSPLRDLL